MPRKRKTQNSVNPGFKTLQLVIDAEIIEKIGSWDMVMRLFGTYLGANKPTTSLQQSFNEFRLKFLNQKNETFYIDQSFGHTLTPVNENR